MTSAAKRAYDKAWRAARTAAHICLRCPSIITPVDGKYRVHCPECELKVSKLRSRSARCIAEARVEEGICTRCGKEDAEPGLRRCNGCNESGSAGNKKRQLQRMAAAALASSVNSPEFTT